MGSRCVRVHESEHVSSPSLEVQSLDWETFEQYCAWQLFLAHNIPLETIIPILQHLKYKGEQAGAHRLPNGPPPTPAPRRALQEGGLPASRLLRSRVLGLYTGGCGDLPAPPRGSRWGCQDLSLEPQLLSGLCPSPQSTRRPCLASCFSFGEKSEFPSHLLTPHPHPTPSLLGPRLWPRLSPYC